MIHHFKTSLFTNLTRSSLFIWSDVQSPNKVGPISHVISVGFGVFRTSTVALHEHNPVCVLLLFQSLRFVALVSTFPWICSILSTSITDQQSFTHSYNPTCLCSRGSRSPVGLGQNCTWILCTPQQFLSATCKVLFASLNPSLGLGPVLETSSEQEKSHYNRINTQGS